MKSNLWTTWVLGALLLGPSGWLQGQPAKSTAPAPPITVPLTDESLLQLLQEMGFEPTTDRSEKSGAVMYNVKFSQDEWNFSINVSLSGNKDFLWLSAYLKQVPTAGASSEALLKLLAQNKAIGPSQVYYETKSRWLVLGMPLLNRGGITRAVFRNHVNLFLGHLKSTIPLCTFPEAPKPPAKEP